MACWISCAAAHDEGAAAMTERFEASNADFARVVRDSFARQGLMSTLGARIVAIEPGLCVIEMDYAPGVSQQNGYFHGGAVGAIADSAAGYAAYSLMPAGSDILTVEYKLNLIRPAVPPIVRAEGRVVRAGKTLSVCRADVYCTANGRMEVCAMLQSTLLRLAPSVTG
jgi:uncharacterized protein (TIGR00369 family)